MTEHELTRRDAMVALSAAGVATVAGAALTWDRIDNSTDDRQLDGADRRKLHAIAEILYPSEVAGVRSFVDSYIAGRVQDRPERAAGISDSLGYLDSYTENWYGQSFLALPQDRRESVLRDMGADLTEPDPEGSDVERLRFYVVNELLFALYTSPTGGELVGIENPQGHPGGTTSYRQPPG